MIVRICCLAIALVLAGCQSGAGTGPAAPVTAIAASFFSPSKEVEERAYSAIVIDARAGDILFEENARDLRYPASLTKMMTLYLLFDAVESGRLGLDSELAVSENAAAQPPSRLGLRAGNTIRVEDALRAMAVRSANDVAVAVAENLAGSEAAFVARMNRTARALGLRDTTFRNASGLPDPGQVTTAWDMAVLGRALYQRYPRIRPYFRLRSFSYAGRRHESTNKLLGEVAGLDGIKTGYIRLSGFNLAASVNRDGRHVIVVVMGGRTGRSRDARVKALIEEWLPAASTADEAAPATVAEEAPPSTADDDAPPVAAAAEDAEAA